MLARTEEADPCADLLRFAKSRRFSMVLADPPWQFIDRTSKMAPEHRRLSRYTTMTLGEISALPAAKVVAPTAHLYLWVPNALLPEGLAVISKPIALPQERSVTPRPSGPPSFLILCQMIFDLQDAQA